MSSLTAGRQCIAQSAPLSQNRPAGSRQPVAVSERFSILGINIRLPIDDLSCLTVLVLYDPHMHSRASAWTRNRLRLTLIITLRLPHPFGVYCTCTPVELTLFKYHATIWDSGAPFCVRLVPVAYHLSVRTEKVMSGQR